MVTFSIKQKPRQSRSFIVSHLRPSHSAEILLWTLEQQGRLPPCFLRHGQIYRIADNRTPAVKTARSKQLIQGKQQQRFQTVKTIIQPLQTVPYGSR